MTDTLFLALAYIRHNMVRSCVLIISLALIILVPLATGQVLEAAEAQLTARAEATPLMIGARGSALDLLMNGLYFTADRPERMTMALTEQVWDSDLAVAIPLHVRFTAGGAPVVGTTIDYFEFRGLEMAEGRSIALLGEAVLGASAARLLALNSSDTLVTDPENLFDIAGTYPLELMITGILQPTGTADDDAVFVDIQTAWVIEGIGHGHNDVVEEDMVVRETDEGIVASAGLRQFTRITPDNIDSFHFHGAAETYPVSSVIAVPPDARSAAVLRGRYLDPSGPQIVVPVKVVEGLLDTILRISQVLDAVFVVVGGAALIAVGLALYLSLRLREAEVETAFRLGCHRLTITRLLAADAFLIVAAAVFLAALAMGVISPNVDGIALWLVTEGD